MGYNFWAKDWMVLGSISNRGTNRFSYPNGIYWFWDPPNFLFHSAKRLGVKINILLPLVSRIRMCGVILLLPPVFVHVLQRENLPTYLHLSVY
jgi:hypothetical protein